MDAQLVRNLRSTLTTFAPSAARRWDPRRAGWLAAAVLAACGHPAAPPTAPGPAPEVAPPSAPLTTRLRTPVTLSIVGTNDLHGALERLPLLGGYVANLRAARAADGGAVLLIDGGDMFQGTLESNLGEGADVVRAYNALGYAAAAVGNHEFDYGPVGPAVTVKSPAEDARGALKARASEAKFPFVVANILDAATGARIDWPNMPASTLIDAGGIKVGIVGASTESTPTTTMPANFVGLKMTPPAPVLAAQAQALRAQGAQVIIATMHIGSSCRSFDNPDDFSSCDQHDELFQLIAGIPRGTLDVIVAGHTHAGVAHRIAGVAVIESYASGRAFGRVDVQLGPDGKVADVRIDKPRALCTGEKPGPPIAVADCKPGDYEGKPVVPDAKIQQIVDEALARAGERRKEKLGVTLTKTVTRSHGIESAEGNWFGDLMLAARPDAQVSLTNGGGLRADLPAGELTYGQLFEAMPFDNRFAILDVTGKELRALVTANLGRGGAFMSWGGLTAKARCAGEQLAVDIRVGGKPLDDAKRYKLATSDFLASGGDKMISQLNLPASAIAPTDVIVREAVAEVLRGWRGTPRAKVEPGKLYDPKAPRIEYPGKRPVTCGRAPSPGSKEDAP